MPAIYLGGTFYQFSAEKVRARQATLEVLLQDGIDVLKPKHADDYSAGLGDLRDKTLTARDRYLVQQSDIVVLDLLECVKPPRGILIETGWADAWGIPVLLIIDPQSPFKFSMLDSLVTWEVSSYQQAADIVNAVLG